MWWIIGIIVVWFILYKLFGTDEARIERALRKSGIIWVNNIQYVLYEDSGYHVLSSSKHGTIMESNGDEEAFISACARRIVYLSRQ